ncbi:hypothetical protein V6N11_034047 [Hibiscus sabdariffa]|uniref:Uncharacterized protein n=1 Tax=Hibiscus sabdariffa TaxID=183260 RepID=A0ABR2S163_9ROSI
MAELMVWMVALGNVEGFSMEVRWNEISVKAGLEQAVSSMVLATKVWGWCKVNAMVWLVVAEGSLSWGSVKGLLEASRFWLGNSGFEAMMKMGLKK